MMKASEDIDEAKAAVEKWEAIYEKYEGDESEASDEIKKAEEELEDVAALWLILKIKKRYEKADNLTINTNFSFGQTEEDTIIKN